MLGEDKCATSMMEGLSSINFVGFTIEANGKYERSLCIKASRVQNTNDKFFFLSYIEDNRLVNTIRAKKLGVTMLVCTVAEREVRKEVFYPSVDPYISNSSRQVAAPA